ncbi:MAG: sodium-dependent transporter [Verrucomicrobiota bacterium]|nr:sodium-dependent transporter [Limisphaera sp.]MDW8381922.1 sodium-dependent transporter [Verrucomicrobiota bacterium]
MQVAVAHEQWRSRWGFVMAAAGSAIGLGNIWRFPYLAGENGGAAFVLVYVVAVALIGLPLMLNELVLGRKGGRDVVGSLRQLAPGTFWHWTGFLCILCSFVVLSYYSVVAGWALAYAVVSALGLHVDFATFAATPGPVIASFAAFLGFTVAIVQAGVTGGIERWSRRLMPLLGVLMLVVLIRSLTLSGAESGIRYYLQPDFGKVDGQVLLKAVGQVLFSLGVGWGLLVTYAAYLDRSHPLPQSALWVAVLDTAVALLAGLMIFPAVFAFGRDPAGGPTLTFQTLPDVFARMPGGAAVGTLFFLLLVVAALTSTIAMLEVPVAWLVQEKRWSRCWAASVVGAAAFVMGIPSALSMGGARFWSELQFGGQRGLMDILDQVFGTGLLLLISLLFSLFTGWWWTPSAAAAEAAVGSPRFLEGAWGRWRVKVWGIFLRWVCPGAILIILGEWVKMMIL